VLSFFGVSHTVLILSYAERILGSKEHFVWLVAATGVGAMVGALGSGRSSESSSIRGPALGLLAYGIGMAVFAGTTNLFVAAATQFIVGYFYFAIMTRLQTLIQLLVDESKRGRVMSLFQICWAGLVPFGSLAMGFLAERFGTPNTLYAGALLCASYGVIMALRPVPQGGPR
jgi:predicted MFS family arabinose efflux permease